MVTNKTVKLSLFTLILAFIVIGTVAIAGVMKNEKPLEVTKKTYTPAWFTYDGIGDQNNPSSYTYNPNGGGCAGNVRLCEILLDSPSQDPNMGIDPQDLQQLLEEETGNPNAESFTEPSEKVHFQP